MTTAKKAPTAKKASTAEKGPAVKKAASAKKAAAVAPAAKPTPRKAAQKKRVTPQQNSTSALFLSKDDYKACIDGLMGQGIEHGDAVETLKVGLRQANGRPVPYELLGMQAANSASASIAA